jgi:tRNA (guanine37-N1)-methyltransferase
MLIKADILYAAWREAVPENLAPERRARIRTILLSPQGPRFDASKAKALAKYDELVFVCGHYEGVDERFIEVCVDEELSIGDYVLTGGELPAMVVADAVARWIPGVVGKEGSVSKDSLEDGLLKYPQYTRPAEFQGRKVPEVLTSGNHAEIERWRRGQSIERTKRKRPDLYAEWEKRGQGHD